MIQVHPLQILGNPKMKVASPARFEGDVDVYHIHACPTCGARCNVFEDGSIICVVENKCFAPDPSNPQDRDLVAMREAYDKDNGISASDRLLIPAQVLAGVPHNLNQR